MSEIIPFDYQGVEGMLPSESGEIHFTGFTQGVFNRVHSIIGNSLQYGDQFSLLYCVPINGRIYTVVKNEKGERVLLFKGKPSYLHGIEDRHTDHCSGDNHIIPHIDTETMISEVGQSLLLPRMQHPNAHYCHVRPVKCIDDTSSFMFESSRNHYTIFGEAIVMFGKERVCSIIGGSPRMQYQDPKNPVSVILQNGDTAQLPSDKPLSVLSIARVCRH